MKLCACGCGEKVKSATARFLTGHHQRLKGINPIRDYTGYDCKHCGEKLTTDNHSNRSKLSSDVDPRRRAWRICKDCLKNQKAKTRDREQSRAYSKKFHFEKWEHTLSNQCRRRARDYGVKCEITPEIILDLYRKQNGKCYWLGIPIFPSKSAKSLNQPSVDRIEPTGDYIQKNCVLSCYFANIGRRNTNAGAWQKSVEKLKNAIRDKYVSSE